MSATRKIERMKNERRLRNTRTGHIDPADGRVVDLYVTAEMVDARARFLADRDPRATHGVEGWRNVHREAVEHLSPLIGQPVAVLFQ